MGRCEGGQRNVLFLSSVMTNGDVFFIISDGRFDERPQRNDSGDIYCILFVMLANCFVRGETLPVYPRQHGELVSHRTPCTQTDDEMNDSGVSTVVTSCQSYVQVGVNPTGCNVLSQLDGPLLKVGETRVKPD